LLKAAAALSYVSFYLLTFITPPDSQQAGYFWLWYGIPSLLILLIPKRWSALAQGLALGQGICLFREALIPVVFGLSSGSLSIGMVSVLSCMFVQVVLFVAALLLGVPSKAAENVLLICGAAASILFTGLSVQRTEGTSRTPMAANVYRPVGCLDRYALAHRGLYPASLEELTRTTGKYCATDPPTSSVKRPQKLFYHPASGADGRIVGYSILFGPDDVWGKVRTAWYVDQTGLIHKSAEGQFASKESSIWSNEAFELKNWSECYAKYAATHPANGDSFDWKTVLRPEGRCAPDIRDIQAGHAHLGQFYTVYFRLKPPDSSGKQWGFYVIVRPDGYGASGVRSYYVDETGIIRATPQNREPNSTDEPTPECEWNEQVKCPTN